MPALPVTYDTLDDLVCDYCDGVADTVHVQPWEGVVPVAVRFACVDHDPGGYWFETDAWFTGPRHLHKLDERFTARDRLLTKPHGAEAVALVERALREGHGVGEWDGPDTVPSLTLSMLWDALPPAPYCRVCGACGTLEYPENASGALAGSWCDEHQPRCDMCGARPVTHTGRTTCPSGDVHERPLCVRCLAIWETDPTWRWPKLGASRALPAFPVGAMPPVLGEWITATATATQTPVDLAACAALGVLSACVMGAVQVDVRDGWREECLLYIVCALESGDRKSAVVRAATAPLRAVERERAKVARPAVARASARREALEQRRKKLLTDAAKNADADKRERLTDEAGDLAAQLEGEPEMHVPRLLADDATPEALGGLVVRHGRIAVIVAESALLDNLAGRYASGRSNLHLVCQAYTGEPVAVDRVSREPESVDRALLTIALCVQPHVLAAFVADPIARDQGLVARCLIREPDHAARSARG